ncbi:hypothetical protein HK102_008049 [Quaeritorhiza haematococci]|nr:hypothetical protein HK102_008049 [Quaeritorhiza haematococci]
MGDEPNEGRVITTIHRGFALVNVYCVNGTSSATRCQYKAHFHRILTQHCAALQRRFATVVVAGDFNIAREGVDVWHPTRYNHLSTCLPHEREWFRDFLANLNLVDTYRARWVRRKFTWFERWKGLPPNPNIGLRVDYIVTNSSTPLVSADIHDNLLELSDHCPISAEVVVASPRPSSVTPLDAPTPHHVTSFSNGFLLHANGSGSVQPGRTFVIQAPLNLPLPEDGDLLDIHLSDRLRTQGAVLVNAVAFRRNRTVTLHIKHDGIETLHFAAGDVVGALIPEEEEGVPVVNVAPLTLAPVNCLPCQLVELVEFAAGMSTFRSGTASSTRGKARNDIASRTFSPLILMRRRTQFRFDVPWYHIEALYDTGASFNIISTDEFARLPANRQRLSPYEGDPLRGVSGSLLRPQWQTVLLVDFGQGVRKEVPFVIIASPARFILGTDFITKHVDAHYPKQQIIVVDGVRFSLKTRLTHKPALHHLAATGWTTIPVDHAAAIQVRTFYTPPELASLTTPLDLTLRYHFLAEDGILAAGNWSAHRDEYYTTTIFVRNASSQPLHLRPGQTLAVLTPERLSDIDLLSTSCNDLLSNPCVPSTSNLVSVHSTPAPPKVLSAPLKAPTNPDPVPSTLAPPTAASWPDALGNLSPAAPDALLATDSPDAPDALLAHTRTTAVTPARDSLEPAMPADPRNVINIQPPSHRTLVTGSIAPMGQARREPMRTANVPPAAGAQTASTPHESHPPANTNMAAATMESFPTILTNSPVIRILFNHPQNAVLAGGDLGAADSIDVSVIATQNNLEYRIDILDLSIVLSTAMERLMDTRKPGRQDGIATIRYTQSVTPTIIRNFGEDIIRRQQR